MAYAAAYPQHVERLILDSTVPTEGVDPLERSTIQAIPAMLRSVCRDGACPFTADPVDDLARLLDRVRATPLDTDIRIGGRSVPAPTNETVVLANILATDVDPLMRAHLPAAIHSALEGDGVPLIMLGGLTGASGSTAQDGISYVLNLATRCEDGPQIWPAGTAVEDRQAAVNRVVDALPRDTFAPFRTEIITTLVAGTATCIGWPDSPIVQPAFTAPTMPTLILSGDDDLRTPPSDAHAVAAAIPGSVLLTVPDTGHSVAGADASGCAKRAITAFAAGATVVPCTDPAKRAIPVGAVAPARFADVEPIAGLPVKVGRTLQAVRLTLADANLRLDWGTVTPVGLTGVGLRGGTTTAVTKGEYRGSAVLQAFSYVPGVTLTGRSKPGGITITVGGASAAHGTVTMDARFRLHGTLGGRRVSLRIPKAELDGTAQGVGPASGDAALGLAAWPATSASTTSSSSAPPASPVG
jgi:pimeloyl-ACP methyl ester carboxylesterase